jgi:hypothetical protein
MKFAHAASSHAPQQRAGSARGSETAILESVKSVLLVDSVALSASIAIWLTCRFFDEHKRLVGRCVLTPPWTARDSRPYPFVL